MFPSWNAARLWLVLTMRNLITHNDYPGNSQDGFICRVCGFASNDFSKVDPYDMADWDNTQSMFDNFDAGDMEISFCPECGARVMGGE